MTFLEHIILKRVPAGALSHILEDAASFVPTIGGNCLGSIDVRHESG